MAGPANVIAGDMDQPTNLPTTEIPEALLEEEKKLARFSQSAEYKRLRDYMEARIEFFQKFLPDGTPVTKLNEADDEIIAAHWRVANIVIAEFRAVLAEYENAQQVVKDARRGN